MSSISIELPLPPKQMHPNRRAHWRAKMKPKAEQRSTARILAVHAIRDSIAGLKHSPPHWKMAEVQSTWYLARENDPDNLVAWMKGTLDGLADAGIVGNDRGFVLMPPKQVLDPKRNGKRGLVLTITERIEPTGGDR